jgi:dTDP-6-deoxy-L-talose 4-dehydrogenase (NAD+)
LTGTLENPPWSGIERFAPEACVHAAWIATPGTYLESPENLDWVHWSLAFVQRLATLGCRHITILGTCIEYQITGQPLREDATPLAPVSLYARCKAELHRELHTALADTGVALAWARIFYPYGEGEHPARLVSSLINRFRRGESVTLNSPASVKDYIHVQDVVEALLRVVECGFAGPVNIGTGEGVTVGSIGQRIAELMSRPDLLRIPAQPVPDPLGFVVADATRLRSLGWRPKLTLEAGLRRLTEAPRS